jgi:hypothetical protein
MALFPLGILSAAGAGGIFSSDYELISSTILGSATSSVTFSSLGDYSSTYKHLQVRLVAAKDASVTNLRGRINGDTGDNYNWHYILGTGAEVVSGNSITDGVGGVLFLGNLPASTTTFTGAVIDYLDAYSTSKNKTVRTLNATSNTNIWFNSGLWRNTASITSLSVFPTSGNFVANSRFSLYGIKG